jgi:hypothetical protein
MDFVSVFIFIGWIAGFFVNLSLGGMDIIDFVFL